MSRAIVIDTNVAVVANGRHEQAGPECVLACIDKLELAMEELTTLLDDKRRVLAEYMSQLSPTGQPGPGDRFVKWLLVNQANPTHCRVVSITPRAGRGEDFEEFPRDPELAAFDPADRKFVAVALASGLNPEIANASDTDWWHFREALSRAGVRVSYLCPELMGDR